MLTPSELELLTGAVDGELDARQHRRLARLLETSTEARETLQRLRRDAAAIRDLPSRTCPVDLSGSVLDAISRLPRKTPQPRRPTPFPSQPSPVGVPAWYALALAASVLLVIGIASYVYFTISQPSGKGPSNSNQPDLAQNNTPQPTPQPDPTPEPIVPGEYKPAPGGNFDPGAIAKLPGTPAPEREPIIPETPTGPIFTGPAGEKFELKTIEPTAPTMHKMQGLERARFLGDLGKAGAFRLELPSRDGAKVVERLQHVLKGQNIAVTVDALAAARLAKAAQWKSGYVLVLEDITPDELANLMEALAEADRKGEPKKANDPTSTPVLPAKMVLSRLNRNDQRELNDHLGAELLFQTTKATGPLGIDPTRPLSDQTAEEIERRLSGKVTRPALLLAYGVPKQVTPSVEVKKYLETRKPGRPGAIQVMLVVRHVG
jgi:hypothetical protein